ncbi:MAG TPA: lactate dehydrogenase [Clostridia bacterium]|nr:lactate dehydrogenase [Clostridia bacterium]
MKLPFYSYQNVCLVPVGLEPPEGAREAERPFAPVVFLMDRNPLKNRFWFCVRDIAGVFAEEGPACLNLAAPKADIPFMKDPQYALLSAIVREHGAAVVNAAFPKYEAALKAMPARRAKGLNVTLAGLGDVGGSLLLGLMLLGGGNIKEIGIYDKDPARMARYEQEMGELLPLQEGAELPSVKCIKEERELFCGSAFLFCASRGVPDPENCGDVRMAQLESNRALVLPYARMARKENFKGLFAQISDPVDILCRDVFLKSNSDENGAYDWAGLLPEQVRGYGLGVMKARAKYAARAIGREADCANLRVYGPHGNGLVAANDPGCAYDDALSKELTLSAINANLKLRETGYKPYIAPAISSACVSFLRTLNGEWHEAATPLGGVYMGCRSRFTPSGVELERMPFHKTLYDKIEETYAHLKSMEV